MNRRKFAAGSVAAALAPYLRALPLPDKIATNNKINLVPEAPCLAPNYCCTWSVQNYVYGQGDKSLSIEKLEGGAGSQLAHDAMAESVLLGPEGWARSFFPQARQELYLMLDDGWESGGTSTFELDKAKFPSFRGSAMERLRGLNLAIRDEGWRSAAVWCRNTPGGAEDDRLEELSVEAGIPYWKVDGGDPEFHLTALTSAKHRPLAIEHVHGEGPVNGDWRKDGRFGPQLPGSRRQQILAHTDVYRTYDVTAILSLPTTLDRTAEMLKGADGQAGGHALLNVEDEVYLAAALGCTMGVMRHPLRGKRPDGDVDLFFNGPRQAKRRMDEVTRAIRWQRIAAPFSPGIGTVKISPEVLQDTWHFKRGETWNSELVEQTVHQSAPAAITRNLELPRVTARGDKPFVAASRFPNGAVALCAQERTQLDRAWYMPACSVELDVADAPGPYAIFGCVDSVTLTFDQPRPAQRLFAQDLLGTEASDITHHLTGNSRRLTLHQADLRRIGLANATAEDLSSPGLVLAWRDR